MTAPALLQIVFYFAILLLITQPLGAHMVRVFEGERTFLHGALGWLERGAYRLLGVDPNRDMKWTTYSVALLAFSLASLLFSYLALRLQGYLPLNPQHFGARQMPPDLAFNTAVSFTTNTNWQSYSPEVTVSYFSNMVALAIHNWASAAVGLSIAIALIRGFARKSANGVGNFWADMVRSTVYLLLPLSLIGAVVFLAAPACGVEAVEEDLLPVYLIAALLFLFGFGGGFSLRLSLFVLFFGLDEVEERIVEQLLLEVLLKVQQRHVEKIHRLIEARIDLQLLPELR